MVSMQTAILSGDFSGDKHQLKIHEIVVLGVLSIAAIVLSSMDQCTRGPSLTAMLLTNASRLTSYLC